MRLPLLATLALAAALAAAPAAAQGFTVVETPVDTTASFTSIAAGDYDGDGRTDLLLYGTRNLVRLEGGPRTNVLELWRNTGSGAAWPFERAALLDADLPQAYPVGTASWVDLDGDGDLDLVISDADDPGPGGGPQQAQPLRQYRNDGGAFTRVAAALPVFAGAARSFYARGLAWGDADNDGDLDLAASGVAEDTVATLTGTRVFVNDGGAFQPGAASYTTSPGTVRWGDVDADGDLDLLSAAYDEGGVSWGRAVYVQVNVAGTFAEPVPVTSATDASADWGDFDGDGDLDVLVTGSYGSGTSLRVFRTDGTADAPTFTATSPLAEGIPGLPQIRGAVWADVDGDGDVDALVGGWGLDPSGAEPFANRTVWLRNDGGALVDSGVEIPGPFETAFGASAWIDVENDGDLDYFFSGTFPERILFQGQPTWCFCDPRFVFVRNDASAPNAAPGAPSALTAAASADGVALSWAPASDDHTPAASLTYNLRVTARGGSDVVSPMSRPGGGARLVPEPGNVSLNTAWALAGLAPGAYTWSVQAGDNAFNGGAFAAEGEFTVGAVAGEVPAGAAPALALGVAPNPAAASAAVTVALAAAATVRVSLFDALGREVAVLHDGPLAAGAHRLALDAARLPSGVYVVRAAGTGGAASRTLTVAR